MICATTGHQRSSGRSSTEGGAGSIYASSAWDVKAPMRVMAGSLSLVPEDVQSLSTFSVLGASKRLGAVSDEAPMYAEPESCSSTGRKKRVIKWVTPCCRVQTPPASHLTGYLGTAGACWGVMVGSCEETAEACLILGQLPC